VDTSLKEAVHTRFNDGRPTTLKQYFCTSPGRTSVSDAQETQRRYKEFLDLMPLTLALAGLPPSDLGRYFSEEQIETRLFVMRHAYKAARSLARELVVK
jgi:hypothetical protein